MKLLSARQVKSILVVTDALGLPRGAVVTPLSVLEEGRERLLPEGFLLLCAPSGVRFDRWIAGLRERLRRLDLARSPGEEAGDGRPDVMVDLGGEA